MKGVSYHKSWWIRLKEEASHLDIDGVPNIVRSKNVFVKIFWLCILVASTTFCVFLMAKTIDQYMHFEVTSLNRLIHEEQAIFPTVTVCNINAITTSYGVKLLRQAKIDMTSDMLVTQLESHFKDTTGKYMNDSVKQKLSDFNDMLFTCTFNKMPCNASQFEWIWHPKYFGCYRFNPRHSHESHIKDPSLTMDGSAFGLVLHLYSGLPNELKDAWPRGFYVLVQNASDYPYGLTPTPIKAQLHQGTKIGVKRSFFSQFNAWPYVYSECNVDENDKLLDNGATSDRQLFERVRETNYTYSQETCIAFCAQLMIEQRCGCMSYLMPTPPPLSRSEEGNETMKRFCTKPDERSCADTFYSEFIKPGFIDAHCGRNKCPLECNKRRLSTIVSDYPFPNQDDYEKVLRPEFVNLIDRYHDKVDKIASVSVLYDTLFYTINEEQAAMSFASLIGLLGGHLGISLLSIVGLIEFMVIRVCAWLRRNKKHAEIRELPGSNHSKIGEHLKRLRIDGVAKIAEAKSLVVKVSSFFELVCLRIKNKFFFRSPTKLNCAFFNACYLI